MLKYFSILFLVLLCVACEKTGFNEIDPETDAQQTEDSSGNLTLNIT